VWKPSSVSSANRMYIPKTNLGSPLGPGPGLGATEVVVGPGCVVDSEDVGSSVLLHGLVVVAGNLVVVSVVAVVMGSVVAVVMSSVVAVVMGSEVAVVMGLVVVVVGALEVVSGVGGLVEPGLGRSPHCTWSLKLQMCMSSSYMVPAAQDSW